MQPMAMAMHDPVIYIFFIYFFSERRQNLRTIGLPMNNLEHFVFFFLTSTPESLFFLPQIKALVQHDEVCEALQICITSRVAARPAARALSEAWPYLVKGYLVLPLKAQFNKTAIFIYILKPSRNYKTSLQNIRT